MDADNARLAEARAGDEAAFRDLVGPHRRGLVAHCYRMCGSFHEAEDLVQEAMLRAWRGLAGFQERSSFKSWVYRIATNAALDSLKSQKSRGLPTALGPPQSAEAALAAPLGEALWLEPFPDALLPDDGPAPESLLSQRQSVGFAFLQALQRLPAKQRAALLLKDVVGSSAQEVAELLDTTVPAVNSLLQRARDTLGASPAPEDADDREREVVLAYMRAFESANVDALVTLLRDDARLSMPPTPSWFQGPAIIGAWLREAVLPPRAAHQFRGVETRANGCPAVALYARQDDGGFALIGVQVVEVVGGRIAEIVAFMHPALVRAFDLPERLA